MTQIVFDVETDGLNPTKIHCLSWAEVGQPVQSTADYKVMKQLVERTDIVLVGHNIVRYDVPGLKKLLKANITCDLIDTLAVSWVISFERPKHGLESYGEEYGVPKPKIEDWSSLSTEEYMHRCNEDVKINTLVWKKQYSYLKEMYEDNPDDLDRFLRYLTFKMDCVREQEEVGLKLDVEHCKKILAELTLERDKKVKDLEAVMPKVPVYKKKTYPKVIYKKDGSFSVQGDLWYNMLKEEGLPEETAEIKKVVGYNEPNANSHQQIKDWLYSLGWEPEHIKQVRDKETGETKDIPQIASKEGGGDVCDSVKALFKKEPKLEILSGLSILNHRISIFNGFLRDQVNGRLYASTSGLTNTLRLQHKTIVNLPAVSRKYGEQIRGAIIADDGHILCGSDLSGIEDKTKRHYIYDYDPEYVEEMNRPDFDAHLDIGILAKMISEEESDFYKDYEIRKDKEGKDFKPSAEDKARYGRLKATRTKSKIVNFSATYKVGAATLARNSGMSLKESKKVLEIYWKRNKAILDVEDSLTIKSIGAKRWQLNPVSKFWYSLRADKDKFSTLNQGTAVFCFDMWIQFVRTSGIKIALQYHDEILFNLKPNDRDKVVAKIDAAMKQTNDRLKLNVEVGCSKDFGENYAACH